ncbi:MAG: FecR domain-containing protein [Treponema sp.]
MNYLRRSDALFILIILLLELLLAFLYLHDINRLFGSRNGAELGTILFKKNTVSRRFNNELKWERLRNKSTVFAYDTIRTGTRSEAEIFFSDGTVCNLLDETLIKLNPPEIKELGTLLNGSTSITTTNGTKTIKIGENSITLNNNSSAIVDTEGDKLLIEVTSGSLEFLHNSESYTVMQHEAVQLDNDQVRVEKPACIPVEPVHNARFVSKNIQPELSFSWLHSEDPAMVHPVLHIANDKAGKKIIAEASVATATLQDGRYMCSALLPIQEGIFYWYVTDDTGTMSHIRRFALTHTEDTELIAPENGTVFTYRTKKPAIRFSWVNSAQASSVIFELSTDAAFSNPIIKNHTAAQWLDVRNLEAGTYYWRVSPLYQQKILGDEFTPTVHQFSILQKDALKSTRAFFPINDYLYAVNTFSDKGLTFSWEENPDAASYELRFYQQGESRPVEVLKTEESVVHITPAMTALFGTLGKIDWTVCCLDEEGNTSPESKRQTIINIDGIHGIKPLYPPDGYTASHSLIMNQRFSWKNTTGKPVLFLLAKDSGFTEIVLKKKVATDSFIGIEVESDTYYWRMIIYNSDGSIFAETEPRSLLVTDPLPAPVLEYPQAGAVVSVLPEDSILINWKPVSTADYYDVTVQNSSGDVIAHNALVSDHAMSIPMGSYPSGTYHILLQALKADTALSTQNIGLKETYHFINHRLTYMTLGTPVSGKIIPGLTALYEGITFNWQAEDKPDTATLVIEQNGKPVSIPVRYEGTGGKARIEELPAGRYEWTVKGTAAGFNISAKEKRYFVIEPIPPLQIPRFDANTMSALIDESYLRQNRNIRCVWQPVEEADFYTLILEKADTHTIIVHETNLTDTSYTFADYEKLSRGDFVWKVEAYAALKKANHVRRSKTALYRFAIQLKDISIPSNSSNQDTEYYGY